MNTLEVLPMSRISQLMEQAAARLLRPRNCATARPRWRCRLNITHAVTGRSAATCARWPPKCEGSGREVRFLVHVFDESGLVASGEHSRAIVSGRRFEGLARRRAGKHSMLLSI
jgi:hypothetical protein